MTVEIVSNVFCSLYRHNLKISTKVATLKLKMNKKYV